MARLIDDVLSGNTRYVYPEWIENDYNLLYPDTSSRGHQVFKESLRQCTVFDITNVSDYFYAGTDQEFWDVGLDFPCPMPPFDGIWMEYNKPKTVVSKDPQTNPVDFVQNFPSRCGCLVYCTGLRKPVQLPVDESCKFDQFRAAALDITRNNAGVRCADAYYELKHGRRVNPEEGFPRKFRKVRDDLVEVSDYLVQINTYSERARVMTGPWQILLIWLNAQGEVMDYVWEVPLIGPSHPSTLIGYDNFGYPAVMALSLLNCHNVVQVTVRPEPKLDKVYRKRHHDHALMTFKRLVIEPVTRIASSKSSGKKTGIVQALHICRGHFKHYGIEGPDGRIRGKLFGKYSGRYWQPSCVKGSAEVGLVAKDYDIHTLEEAHGALPVDSA